MATKRYLPFLQWMPGYRRDTLISDLVAALIVTIMLIPQSLAYALLAGVPPEAGLYASMLPLVFYTVFGTSRALSIGPVAITALMTAAAVGGMAAPGSPEYLALVVLVTVLSGLMLMAMGLLRLGFLANFLSHPVISGFISASAVVIIASQLKHVLGIGASGQNLVQIGESLWSGIGQIHAETLVIGLGSMAFLLAARRWLKSLLVRIGFSGHLADLTVKASPIVVVTLTTVLAWALSLADRGVAVVGSVPGGLPGFTLPPLDLNLWHQLAGPALMIGVIGFVESVSVGQTLAAKRRQQIDPDQELIALGVSNLGAGFSGGMPVTASFSRSAVNFEAGAVTPAAGTFTAIAIAVAALFLTPLIADLPKATLAATIIVSVAGLIDLPLAVRTWQYAKADFLAMLATVLLTLVHSVEAGIFAGVGLSIALFLYRTARPHAALVGRVPGTEHFRNVQRHQVETSDPVAMLRVDESLYFANARFLEETILDLVSSRPNLQHLVLVCPAVNQIDASALESLEAINDRLADANVLLHLSEVKGPVMDRLGHSDFLDRLSGQVFLSTYEAWRTLAASSAH